MKRRSLLRMTLAATATILISYAAPASGTVARFLELQEHIDLSQLVIRATAGSERRSFVGDDGMSRTEIPFTILESYKGELKPGSVVWLRQFGSLGGEGLLPIAGDATFTDGEEVVLFLRTEDRKTVYLTALSQSKYDVVRETPAPIIVRDMGGLAFYQPGAKPRMLSGGGDAPVSLDLFRQTIVELAATGR